METRTWLTPMATKTKTSKVEISLLTQRITRYHLVFVFVRTNTGMLGIIMNFYNIMWFRDTYHFN